MLPICPDATPSAAACAPIVAFGDTSPGALTRFALLTDLSPSRRGEGGRRPFYGTSQ